MGGYAHMSAVACGSHKRPSDSLGDEVTGCELPDEVVGN